MSSSHYHKSYQAACERYVEIYRELYGHERWEEWSEEVVKIKAAWKWSVAGMLTQSDTNDPRIWDALGDALFSGRGVERDLAQAEQWYRKAAEAEYGRSMVSLGRMLSSDGRSPEEIAESVQWYQRAAELGDASGMTCLGFAYSYGTGLAPDNRQAADWFIKAHNAGRKGVANLAGCALCGRRESHSESVKWLRIAVEEGNELSNYNLALIFEDRESPEHNPEEAFRCWSIMAERPKGNDIRFMAMLRLARCCRDGIGTRIDRHQAMHWLDHLIALEPKKAYRREAVELRKDIVEGLI